MNEEKKSWVGNREAASQATGLTIDHLKACKVLGCPHAQGRYYPKEIVEWYNTNKEQVEEYLQTSNQSEPKGYWKERKEKALAITAEINLQTLQKKTLDKEKTLALLKAVFSAIEIQLRNQPQELQHKLLGNSITDIGVNISKYNDNMIVMLHKTLEGLTSGNSIK